MSTSAQLVHAVTFRARRSALNESGTPDRKCMGSDHVASPWSPSELAPHFCTRRSIRACHTPDNVQSASHTATLVHCLHGIRSRSHPGCTSSHEGGFTSGLPELNCIHAPLPYSAQNAPRSHHESNQHAQRLSLTTRPDGFQPFPNQLVQGTQVEAQI